MLRRTLLAAGLAVPVLHHCDVAFALPAGLTRSELTAHIAQRLRAARRQFDASDIPALMTTLPRLLASARHTAETVDAPAGWALLSSAYALATDTFNKVGLKAAARRAADESAHFAAWSEEPLAMAASARALGMMLRKEGRPHHAAEMMTRGVDILEATGVRTPDQAWMYVYLLCARGYTYSFAGDRNRALEGVAEAERAVTRLNWLLPASTAPFVRLYRVNVLQTLGDVGNALRIARDLRDEMYPTPERRGRLYTDLARAWWQFGRPEQTTHALLAAYGHAPAEVRDRPGIRRIAVELLDRYPRVAGARHLAATVGLHMT